MTITYHTDTLIIGGGVAGLWLLNRLRGAGYEACLLERDKLGAGQTIASQGMIHGGIKYALGGALNSASETIADMPAHWKACLQGKGDVDLRGCRILSEAYYMWPKNNVRSRLSAFLGSKAVVGKVDRVAADRVPEFFQGRLDGPLYQLQDVVLDVPSLLETLRARQQDRVFRVDWNQSTIITGSDGSIEQLMLNNQVAIKAQRYILCCGAGTTDLIRQFNLPPAPMQRRPLQMVMVKHPVTAPLYVHCVSDKLSTTPEVTITSHQNAHGDPVWYLGGALAERGANLGRDQVIADGKTLLANLFPWCDFSTATWSSLAVDRAEAQQADGKRPDTASLVQQQNLLVCWPTKLTLAPVLANRVVTALAGQQVSPADISPPDLSMLPRPDVAPAPWADL